ncbi:hypothetical protein [Eubacterium oxidoreducens]|nr:hypothetical protein [Eubacterium oxidoreducens]
MSIYVPERYLNPDGTINRSTQVAGYTAESAPVILANHSDGGHKDVPDGCRKGTYYNSILDELSKAINAFGFSQELFDTYTETENWLKRFDNGTYQITDLAGFIRGTGLKRNKPIPGFDRLKDEHIPTRNGLHMGPPGERRSHFFQRTWSCASRASRYL